jgi:hypothetical protein
MAKKRRTIIQPNTRPTFTSDRSSDFFGDRLLKRNQKKFNGVTIAKHYKGKTLKNKFGECYQISATTKIDTVKPNHMRE